MMTELEAIYDICLLELIEKGSMNNFNTEYHNPYLKIK